MTNQPTNEHPNIKASREQRLSREEMIRRYEQYIADPHLQRLQAEEHKIISYSLLIFDIKTGDRVIDDKAHQRLQQIKNERDAYIAVEYADILRSGKK